MIIDQLIAGLVSGITLGSIYALMSLGLSFVWGTLKILNWAHGALFMFGAYIAWVLIYQLGLTFLVSTLIVVLIEFLMGLILYYSLIKPHILRQNFLLLTIVTTLAFQFVSESIALVIFGARYRRIEPPISGSIIIGQSPLTGGDLLIILVSIAVFTVIYLFLTKTKHGLALRAVSQDIDGSQIVGINVNKTYAYAIGVSAALAAIAGILLSSRYFVEPHVGFIPMLKSFTVIVFGGLGSWKGTIIAAYIVGIVEAFAALYIGLMWALPTLFLLLMIILIVKPTGLFGYEE
jgi:branched-chain amino acid transport system permease protein